MNGPELWARLHEASIKLKDPEDRKVFLMSWLESIPSEGCPCKRRFINIMKELPPDYVSFVTWAWRVHNRVNSKLGKPTFTWRQFVQKWRYLGKKDES